MRDVIEDVVFDGFLIPEFASVRMCLWESHHAEDIFPDPHRFDAERFLADPPSSDHFAPFGVDHHQCPYGRTVVRIGTAYLRTLAQGYEVAAKTPGNPVRGAYHWEPSPAFSVKLVPRQR